MPYCPSCRSEYRAGTTSCADCGEKLVEALPEEKDRPLGERVDIYVCSSQPLATRVLAVLEDGGIGGLVRFRGSTAFPMTAGTENQHIIAVREDDAASAIELIRAAIADEVIDDDGELLTPEADVTEQE